MPLTRLAWLFQKYFSKTATPEEAAEFMRLASREEHAAELQALMEQGWAAFEEAEPVFDEEQSEAMLRAVLGKEVGVEAAVSTGAVEIPRPGRGKRRRLGWRKMAAAAVLAGGLGWGGWWWAHHRAAMSEVVARTEQRPAATDIRARGNTAVLVLDDGSTVVLDSKRTGIVTTQGRSRVMKLNGGRVAYDQAAGGETTVLYNTVRTPRGGQYQVSLADGSRVWLNAATALRFPTAFTGKDRTVELTGEAYFEIAPDKNRPFHVKVNDMTVDVLGTQFNVMAYTDEASVNTTLLSGAVRVQKGDERRLLQPGQEARLVQNAAPGADAKPGAGMGAWHFLVAAADTDGVVAWKNGLFQFEGATLEAVMREAARWYDVEVRFEGVSSKHFTGQISRSTSLAEFLRMLGKVSDMRFVVQGRTVVVRRK